jgi:tagatose-1,6-bisphosphate aldolase non-catalytic subunit AgaZ/GatZ
VAPVRISEHVNDNKMIDDDTKINKRKGMMTTDKKQQMVVTALLASLQSVISSGTAGPGRNGHPDTFFAHASEPETAEDTMVVHRRGWVKNGLRAAAARQIGGWRALIQDAENVCRYEESRRVQVSVALKGRKELLGQTFLRVASPKSC